MKRLLFPAVAFLFDIVLLAEDREFQKNASLGCTVIVEKVKVINDMFRASGFY